MKTNKTETTGNIVVSARMDSRRLAGKCLQPLNDNITVIDLCLNRLKQVLTHFSHLRIDLVLATSERRLDDDLVNHVERHHKDVLCYRGDSLDVLGRYVKCVQQQQYSWLVRITGDSPFIDSKLVIQGIEKHLSSNSHFTTNLIPRHFPKGQSVEVLSRKTLNDLNQHAKESSHREHVTLWLYENISRYNYVALPSPQTNLNHLNLSIDTSFDLKLLRRVAKIVGSHRLLSIGYEELIDVLVSLDTGSFIK